MKYYVVFVIAVFCISSALGASTVGKFRSKNEELEKEFNEHVKTIEADLKAYRLGNKKQANDNIARLRQTISGVKNKRCADIASADLDKVEQKKEELIKQISSYYDSRKAAIKVKSDQFFTYEYRYADVMQKKYDQCGDDNCRKVINESIDANTSEPSNHQSFRDMDSNVDHTRRYSLICTELILFLTESVDTDLSRCVDSD